jgi:hypothetical protein
VLCCHVFAGVGDTDIGSVRRYHFTVINKTERPFRAVHVLCTVRKMHVMGLVFPRYFLRYSGVTPAGLPTSIRG